MMQNKLLMGTVAYVVVFFLIGYFVPWDVFEAGIAVYLVVASSLAAMIYLPDTIQILFRRYRDASQPGAHLAVYGAFGVAFGGVVAALASIAVLVPEMRPWIVDQPPELLGRGLVAAAFIMLFISPNMRKKGVSLQGGPWWWATVAAIMAVIYALGYNAGWHRDAGTMPFVKESDAIYQDGRFICNPRAWPVIVSSTGIYHVTSSPYRLQIEEPQACFATVSEAEEAGFRAPG